LRYPFPFQTQTTISHTIYYNSGVILPPTLSSSSSSANAVVSWSFLPLVDVVDNRTQRFYFKQVIMTTQQSTRIEHNNKTPHYGFLRGAFTRRVSLVFSSFQRCFFENRPFDPLIAPWLANIEFIS
jgi:hypothetical protein